MGKIIIFYKYVNIENPDQTVEEQRSICQQLGIKGRILIARQGINATVGGDIEAIEKYKAHLGQHPYFFDVDIKESEGEADHFPRLQVTAKKAILNFGVDPQELPLDQAGRHLSPEEVQALLDENPDDLIVLDARNNYESRIGYFRQALKPDIDHFRNLPEYIDENAETFRGKRILMYCTSGIRCEPASTYLKLKNVAQEVMQIRGGIQRYLEKYPDGHFRGKNYVFDGRIAFGGTNEVLAQCEQCSCSYDEYSNCINAECNKQIIVCPPCIETYHNTCSDRCKELVVERRVNIRRLPHKILIPKGSACSL